MIEGREMLELILKRQSDRKYSDRPIEHDKLERILEAGRLAPSACNAQPWKFIAVNEMKLITGLAEAASAGLVGMNGFVSQAACIIVVVRENPNFSSMIGSKVLRKDYSHFDIGIATGNICLQAAAEGIGSCVIGWFDEKMVKNLLQIPKSKRVDLLITLGYSLSETRMKKRKEKQITVSYNKY